MKTSTIVCCVCFVLALVFALGNNAQATTLTSVLQADFGLNTVHETFGETIILPNPNAVIWPYEDRMGSLVIVGTSNNYEFSQSHVSLTSPMPNILGDNTPEISVVEKNQYVSFGTYGELLANSGLIPGGSSAGFLMEWGESSNHFAPFILTFPGNGATEVGGDFIMLGQTPSTDQIVLTAYDGPNGTGNLLGTVYVPACQVSAWTNNFLGIATNDGSAIKSIGVDYSTNPNCGYPGIANLMFVPATIPTPEPGTMTLLAFAGVFGGLFLRRRVHRQPKRFA